MKRFWRWLIKTGFSLLYNELAWSYNWVSWLVSLGEWRKWQMAALPFVVGPAVLEVAHGPGYLLVALSGRNYRLTGFDLSPAMGRLAGQRLRRAGYQVPLVRGLAQSLPFGANRFDTVLTTFPTAFILAPATLQAIYRVLKPGGRLIIVPEGHLTGRSGLVRFITWLFVITGQAPAGPAPNRWQFFEQQLVAAGFQCQLKETTLPRSSVTVIVAHKAQLEDTFSAGTMGQNYHINKDNDDRSR